MQEVLNELFYGNVHPNEKQFIRDSEYGKAIKIVRDCEDRSAQGNSFPLLHQI